jgi:hypothetical protein
MRLAALEQAVSADDDLAENKVPDVDGQAPTAASDPASDAGDDVHPDDEVTDLSMPIAVGSPAPGVELVVCPRCGAANAAQRRSCGRCATVLVGEPVGSAARPAEDDRPDDDRPDDDRPGDDHRGDDRPEDAPTAVVPRVLTGTRQGAGQREAPVRDGQDTPPVAVPTRPPDVRTASDAPPPRPRGRGRRRMVVVGVVVVGIAVGSAFGMAAALGLWPFEPIVDLPEFDAAAYAQDPQELRPARAGASSVRDDDPGPVGAVRTVDTSLATMWVSGDVGTPVLLRHVFDRPVWLTSIRVAHAAADDPAYTEYGHAVRARIDFGHGQRVVVSLLDQPGEQVVNLPVPRLTDAITWEILDVAGGDEVALAEITYVGYPASDEDVTGYPAS